MNNLLLFSMVELSESMVAWLNANLGIWYLIILNAFGVLAIILKVIEYQVSKRGLMMLIATLANVSWIMFFALSGNFVAALTCILIVLRMLVYMQREKHKWARSVWWVVLFVVLQTVVAVTTFKNLQDLFSIAAGYIGIFAYLTRNQTLYRILSFIYMSLWLSNSICYFIALPTKYLVALLSDSFSTGSVAVGIWRYDLCKKAREERKAKIESANQDNDNKE